MLAANELPIFKGENKGSLINTADSGSEPPQPPQRKAIVCEGHIGHGDGRKHRPLHQAGS